MVLMIPWHCSRKCGNCAVIRICFMTRRGCSHHCRHWPYHYHHRRKRKEWNQQNNRENFQSLQVSLHLYAKKSPNDKVVIVSNFTSALTLIERFVLKIRKWSWIRLDGTIEQRDRQPMVDSFNRGTVDHSFVFLLSSKAGGRSAWFAHFWPILCFFSFEYCILKCGCMVWFMFQVVVPFRVFKDDRHTCHSYLFCVAFWPTLFAISFMA